MSHTGFATPMERYDQLVMLYDGLSGRYTDLQVANEAIKKEMLEFKTRSTYWEEQFNRAKSREDELKLEIEELKTQLKKREQQLFGRKSEKMKSKSNLNFTKDESTKRKRGQQAGSEGHGRRDYSYLPATEETVELKAQRKLCKCCGLPYEELPGTEDSESLEIINVSAYRRVIHRKKYKRGCRCQNNPDPQIISAPQIEKLIPKSKLGISIWALLLINKFEYQLPLNRSLEQLENYGLPLAIGTVMDGLKKLAPFFTPVYDAIVKRSIAAKHWHADETGWKVFESVEGKKNHRWFLWIFHNAETVVYKMSPTRSSDVLKEHFGENHQGGILNVDRYGAYKVIAKSGLFILAFCWAHVRRDFLEYAKACSQHEAWALAWVDEIANLYHINNERIVYPEKSKPFRKHDIKLKTAILKMKKLLDLQLNDKALLPSARKILTSLNEHWEGLIVFVQFPNIPMDNNLAERALRGSVVGRKNYYGSGSIWSAQLAAMIFTIFETLKIWKVNPHTWLLTYLQECVMYDGSPPTHIDNYLPWEMKPDLLKLFANPPVHENPVLSSG